MTISDTKPGDTGPALHTPPSSPVREVKVWDPAVRVFHWTLVGAFATAYLAEDWMALHVNAGYVVGALLAFRLVWGLIGTRHARFSDFVHRPATVLAYLRDLIRASNRRYLGHNPAGGAMVIALLLALLLTVLSGLAVYGADAGAGPLAPWLAGSPEWLEEAGEELHEFFANLTVVLVVVHVGGVIWESLHFGESLVKSMFTGRKRAPRGHDE